MKTYLLAVLMLGAATARADEPKWWLLSGKDAIFPVVARELPATAGDAATAFHFGLRNDRGYTLKCELEARIDESDGDDVLTETVPLGTKILHAGRTGQAQAVIRDEDVPEGYHLVLGSQRVLGSCLGLADGTAPSDAPSARSQCSGDGACLSTCQAEPGGKACASPHASWGDRRFLVPGEGESAGPALAVDLYGNGAGTTAAAYLGPKAEARVCAGRLSARYERPDAPAEADVKALAPKVLRAGRSLVFEAQGGVERAQAGWNLAGGGGEVFCVPYDGGGGALPDPEAAYQSGAAGAERLAVDATLFTIAR